MRARITEREIYHIKDMTMTIMGHPTKLAIAQVRTAINERCDIIDACLDKLSDADRSRAFVQVTTGGGCRVMLDGEVLGEWQDDVCALDSDDGRGMSDERQ